MPNILDYYLRPSLLKTEANKEQRRKKRLESSQKKKSEFKQGACTHLLRYEKWIHNGHKQGKTFHYKEVCIACGLRRFVPRTKKLYALLKDEPWHQKKQ